MQVMLIPTKDGCLNSEMGYMFATNNTPSSNKAAERLVAYGLARPPLATLHVPSRRHMSHHLMR